MNVFALLNQQKAPKQPQAPKEPPHQDILPTPRSQEEGAQVVQDLCSTFPVSHTVIAPSLAQHDANQRLVDLQQQTLILPLEKKVDLLMEKVPNYFLSPTHIKHKG